VIWRAVVLAIALLMAVAHPAAAQRTIRVSDAWVTPAPAGDTLAYAVIENGTMYDVYLTAAETDAAESVELRQATDGSSGVVKEVPIPAFDRLAMTGTGTHLKLKGLKRALRAGDMVPLALVLDNGDRLSVTAMVK
jgi:copper(I)-binding protein